MFFQRELYQDITQWAKTDDRALCLEGPRQVGKTELLKKLGRECFTTFVYIDLRAKSTAARFENLLDSHREKFGFSGSDDEKTMMWEALLTEWDSSYVNSDQTLVVIDEIQHSPTAYNSIRSLRRSLRSKLAVSGSYLGIVTQSQEFWESAGDTYVVELASFSFTEFLKANGIWEEYDLISTVDWAQLSPNEQEICEQVRELYRVYCKIGGYPDVVTKWVESKDIEKCSGIVSSLLRSLYKESSEYFGNVVGHGLWSRTLERLAAHMVTKSGDLDIALAKEEFRNEDSKGLEIRRKDKVNALKWLEDCRIVGMAQIYDELGRVAVLGSKSLFYFRDMGIMAQLCENSMAVLPSDLEGMMAENFVYLQLLVPCQA